MSFYSIPGCSNSYKCVFFWVCMCFVSSCRSLAQRLCSYQNSETITPAQAHPCQEVAWKLKWTNSGQKVDVLNHVCVCVPTSVCMFMGVAGWANLVWFSTVCYHSSLHSHWIGDESASRAVKTTTMPKLSMRKRDRQTGKDGETDMSFHWAFRT